MRKEDLTKDGFVMLNGHFYPLIFVDMSIPTAAIGATCTYAGRSIEKEINDGKKKFYPKINFIQERMTPLAFSIEQEEELLFSISDINL